MGLSLFLISGFDTWIHRQLKHWLKMIEMHVSSGVLPESVILNGAIAKAFFILFASVGFSRLVAEIGTGTMP